MNASVLFYFLLYIFSPSCRQHGFVLWINRCWRVDWPYKDDINRFKDANEVTFLL